MCVSKRRLRGVVGLQAALDGPMCRVGPLQPSMSCCPRALESEGRKVAFAFESPAYGRLMMAWAVKYCLFPDDEVYVVHCITKARLVYFGEPRQLLCLVNSLSNRTGQGLRQWIAMQTSQFYVYINNHTIVSNNYY
jgi:hypothetical protein